MKTSYYANLKSIDQQQYIPVAISGDEGKLVGFEGRARRDLSPYYFFKKWKEKEVEIENAYEDKSLSKEEYRKLKKTNEDAYIKKFYQSVLKPLDPKAVYKDLGENAILLCFETPTEFCHRFLIAGWLELNLGIKIDELGFENDKSVIENKERLKNEIKKYMQKENLMGKENE